MENVRAVVYKTGYLTRFSSSAPIHRGQSSMCFRSHRIPAPKPFHIFPYCSVPTVPTTSTLKTHPSIHSASHESGIRTQLDGSSQDFPFHLLYSLSLNNRENEKTPDQIISPLSFGKTQRIQALIKCHTQTQCVCRVGCFFLSFSSFFSSFYCLVLCKQICTRPLGSSIDK